MRLLRAGLLILAALLAGGLALPSAALHAQGGRGVIREGGPTDVATLHPLRCASLACWRLAEFLYPTLIGVDHGTGTFALTALATGSETSQDGLVVTFQLRDDVLWSDGQPVTAYDVLYTVRAIASQEIGSPFTSDLNAVVAQAEAPDPRTIVFTLHEPSCALLGVLDFPVIPAHVFAPEFTRQPDAEYDFAFMRTEPFLPEVTAGLFHLESIQPSDYIRLATADGALAYELVEMPAEAAWQRFLSGDLNVIEPTTWDHLADLTALDDTQVFTYPGLRWAAIRFNLADPRDPQDAFDDEGARLDQGHHPIFGDARVRRAVQMALDVEALIEAATQGYGTPLAANQVPTSWAYDPDLDPIAYDPTGAERLLHSAGWRDARQDGLRICVGCLYADEGTLLSFRLAYDNATDPIYTILANMIQEQLWRVGFQVELYPISLTDPLNPVRTQRHDAYLEFIVRSYPVNPDQSAWFTSVGDVIGTGANAGSYFNPQVEDLMAQARALPGCDLASRVDLYHEIQAILHDDQPYAWLFVTHNAFAVRGVTGFVPYPFAPFWNVGEWVIEGNQP